MADSASEEAPEGLDGAVKVLKQRIDDAAADSGDARTRTNRLRGVVDTMVARDKRQDDRMDALDATVKTLQGKLGMMEGGGENNEAITKVEDCAKLLDGKVKGAEAAANSLAERLKKIEQGGGMMAA